VNYKKIYSVFVSFLLAFSLLSVQFSHAATFSLSVKAECGYIMLQWDKVPGALRYYIYRGPAAGQEYSMPLTDFAITDNFYKDQSGLLINQKYFYLVKAVDKNNQEFMTSNEAGDVYACNTTIPVPPEIGPSDCRMVLKYQVDNRYYWKNDIQKGPMDASPELRYSRVNLMARYLAEEIGATVGWNNATQAVSIKTLDGTTIEMIIGQSIAKVNGVPTPLDPNNPLVVPYISNSRTYTPLRFISYYLGAKEPSDIIWRGDVNTAELTFKDPNCKWLNGAIRILPTSYYQYGFYENCTTSNPINIPDMNLKDSVLSLSFSEYIKEYSNQNYWCAQIRVDENNNIISWRGRPDLFPNCCSEAPAGKARIIGYVNGSGSNPGTTITVYNSSGSVVWTGQTSANGYYETSTSGNCTLPCPATYKIVASRQGCTFYDATQTVTFTDKQCCGDNEYQRVDFWSKCPGIETSRIIGYVYGSGTNPGTTVQVYNSVGTQVWSGQTDQNGYYETSALGFDGILECPGTYRVTAAKSGITFSISSQTVSFALGESCEEGKYKRVNFTSTYTTAKTGRIVGYVYGASGASGVKVTVTDSTGAQVWSGETDINGYYETSVYGSSCILIVPGTYRVVPSKEGCTFSASYETVTFSEGDNCENGNYKRVDFRSNCTPTYKGRIMGFIFGYDANPGTTISIFDNSGALVWRGLTDANGYYETSAYRSICILKSPGTYKVVPSKAGCTFSSSFETVIFTDTDSCEDGNYKRVDFRSNCAAGKTARITGNITGSGGNPGTIVTVYDSSNRQIWTGQTDRNGYYETSESGLAGILKCPGTYKVVPTKINCTFSESSKYVTFASNESVEDGTFKRVDFTSNCSPMKQPGLMATSLEQVAILEL